MTTVTPATTTQTQTSTAQSQTAAEGSTGGTMIDSDFQTFLVMLTTQLQNQDPLNPMEASDFAVQLATFAGVEQQVKSNDLLESIQSQLGQSTLSQLAGWIGMEGRVTAPAYFDGMPVTLMPEPATGADRADLVVYDETGKEVGRYAVAPTDEPLIWGGAQADGTPFPAGLYDFRLESYFRDEKLADSKVDVYAEIIEARPGTNGATLILEGGTEIGAEAVKALRKAEAPVQNAA